MLNTLICSLLGLPWILTARKVPAWLSLLWHRMALKILQIKVNVRGQKIADGQSAVFCSNHLSYLDIMVLGSLIGGRFVSRADVRHWPLMGYLAKRQGTIFIERKKRQAEQHVAILQHELQKPTPLIIFAEGTSSAGIITLPIKSTLLQPLVGIDNVPIQPVTISYKKHYGLPMGRIYEPLCAWYGDMELAPHLLEFLSLGPIDVEVVFHPITTMDKHEGNRKLLADYLHKKISEGLTMIRQYRL